MHLRQFYVGCLAHASYLIGDGGEAVVVDPSRDIEMYLDEAAVQGLRITWVLETHLHADFVSGHRELAARTGATIGIGTRAFAVEIIPDGPRIVRAEVEPEFADRLKPSLKGKAVDILDHNNPKLKYKEVVKEIGRSFLPPSPTA